MYRRKGIFMCEKKNLQVPFLIPPDAIGLPTKGAVVETIRYYAPGEPEISADGSQKNDILCLQATGKPAVSFTASMKTQRIFVFRRDSLKSGTGRCCRWAAEGLTASFLRCADRFPEQIPMKPVRWTRGYAVFGSDSGHQMGFPDFWDCSWALNQESLENFAYAQLKKTADTVRYLARHFYGEAEQRLYFYGGSNGGRECLQCLQRYPEDYDGAVCFYPAMYWVGKLLIDRRNECFAKVLGSEALITKEQRLKMREALAQLCGDDDGIVTDLGRAETLRKEIEAAFGNFLNEKQMDLLRMMAAPLVLPASLNGGYTRMAGYGVWEGAPVADRYGTEILSLPSFAIAGTERVLSTMVMREPDFPMLEIDLVRDRQKLQQASRLLDASSPDLDRFTAHGGKLILLHGMADGLVPIQGTREYVKRLQDRYGASLEQFLRYYELPGFGHTYGETFQAGLDAVRLLDTWVREDRAPENIVVTDCLEETYGRTREVRPVRDILSS